MTEYAAYTPYRGDTGITRLVPSNFAIPLDAHVIGSTTDTYPGYPSRRKRLIWSANEILEWEGRGRPHEDLRKKSSRRHPFGTNFVMEHPNYLQGLQEGLARGDDGEQDFSDVVFKPSLSGIIYERDSRGIPLFPYYRAVLQHGFVGGLGRNWDYGPNYSQASVAFGEKGGKLYAVAIKKPGFRGYLVPGGMIENRKGPVETAVGELHEETDLDLSSVNRYAEVVYQGILPGNPTKTGHAWMESYVVAVIPEDLDITHKRLRTKDPSDAKNPTWLPINRKTLELLHMSEANYVRKAILALEKRLGVIVTPDGTMIPIR
jgi:ADP-ribose pyrophosphatase YjhB (NUDIX family)